MERDKVLEMSKVITEEELLAGNHFLQQGISLIRILLIILFRRS